MVLHGPGGNFEYWPKGLDETRIKRRLDFVSWDRPMLSQLLGSLQSRTERPRMIHGPKG